MKVKSYGFSGGSGMRDGDYIRKVKKGGSGRHVEGSEQGAPTNSAMALPTISPEKANAWYTGSHARSESPDTSEGTATPTSSFLASVSTHPHLPRSASPSGPLSLSLPPQLPPPRSLPPPTPDSADYPSSVGRPQKKRQSLLAGLSQAQMKRISMALEEIEGRLQKETPNGMSGLDEVEEILQNSAHVSHARLPSDARSERTQHSVASSLVPYSPSPSDVAGRLNRHVTEPVSPPKLPASQRSHNLLAHVQETRPSPSSQPFLPHAVSEEPDFTAPRPILTPSRTQPVRHLPTNASSSSSSQLPLAPMYIPGQPRPVGAMHRSTDSTDSISSRSATSINQPLSPSQRSSISSSKRARSDSTSSSMRGPLIIVPRGSSLARSQSVSQGSDGEHGPSFAEGSRQSEDVPSTAPVTSRRMGSFSLGEALDGRRVSSPLAMLPPTPTATIEEAEEASEIDDRYIPNDRKVVMPRIQPVWSRRSVAESRRESYTSLQPGQSALGWALDVHSNTMSRPVSAEGEMDGSSDSKGQLRAISLAGTLRKESSMGSFNSDFAEPLSDDVHFSAYSSASLITPGEENEDYGKILRKLSGVGSEEMSILQDKLVERAKLEREALRGALDESPPVPVSFTV